MKPLRLGRDREVRLASGRRTRTRSAAARGRYVGSRLAAVPPDVAVDATLRAAAPWQVVRGRGAGEAVDVRAEDLRHKRRERRMGHLVVFCVDASGSMAAQRRMEAAKTAVLSLLTDCYQRRDRVAFVAFRKDRAEVLLPPSSSVELAARRLRELPTGGRTPLAAGLAKSREVILEGLRRHPKTRPLLVLVTDGRANTALGAGPILPELDACARALAEIPGLDALVVDTEAKDNVLRADLAARVAAALGAPCVAVEELEADALAGWVRAATRNG